MTLLPQSCRVAKVLGFVSGNLLKVLQGLGRRGAGRISATNMQQGNGQDFIVPAGQKKVPTARDQQLGSRA